MTDRFLSTLIVVTVLAHGLSGWADPTDDFIRQEMAARRIPGVALTVIQNGEAVKTAAYGFANLEWNVPVATNTVFEIGSLTKQLTAAGILLLAQDGKLSVEDSLAKYLPEVPAAWTNVTLRHLLAHTSGLKSYTGLDGFELTRHLTRQQFIQQLAAQPMEFQPGEKFKYCNSGYNLLGYVIEAVSGQSYQDFLRERILQALGMNATTDRNPKQVIPHRASGYEQTTNHIHINRDDDLTDVFSAGAMVSTVGDLAKWNAMLDSDTLLTGDSKRLMWTPGKLNDGSLLTYGFGWRMGSLEGHRNIGHSGSTSGFSASLQRYPDDRLAVIVLTNTDEAIATKLAEKLATFYFAVK